MITETLTVTRDGKNIKWMATPGASDLTLANGVGNIAWTTQISVFDCDQVNLICSPTWGAGVVDMRLRVQWSADVSGFRWAADTFVTAAIGGGTNVISANINELRFDTVPGGGPFLFPVPAHWMRIGVYSNGVPDGGSLLQVDVERMRTYPTQQ